MVIKGDLCILRCGKLHPLRAAIRAWLVGVYERVHADNLVYEYMLYTVYYVYQSPKI